MVDFFNSLYASMGITDNPEKQGLLNNYVPVIAVTYEDGYYIYFSEELKGSDNYMYTNKRWSEKFPYYYEDDDFIYSFTLTDKLTIYDKKNLLDTTKEQTVFTLDYHELSTAEEYAAFRAKRPGSFLLKDEDFYLIRKGTIINCIEKSLSYYCNKHNKIAQQLNITYNFALPVVDDSEWVRSIDNPSIVVLFQGYPYGDGSTDTYNRFAISGSNIKKDIVYYLEQKSWYYVYHKEGCSELSKDGLVFLDEPYYTVSDCAKKGAYACPYCSGGNGAFAPDYTP
jgi:hypothetical protein